MKTKLTYSKYPAVLLLLTFIFAGCNDWLSIAPENDLIKEKFWSKKEDADGALAAAYDAFRDAALESFVWGELRADIVTLDGAEFADYQNIAASNISPSNGKVKWDKYYNAINLANTLMYYSPVVMEKDESFTLRMKEAYDAEALFIRALSYFYLVRLWKDVPLVTEASISDQGDLFLPKSSEKEVIQQIITDLLRAKDLAYVDEYRYIPHYYKGRANKYSIMALLADVYLWNEQYQECINYCDSISNTGKFALEENNNWFLIYNPGNNQKESLFEIQFDDNLESQENPIYYSMIPTSGGPKIKFNDVTMNNLFNDQDLRLIGTKGPVWKYQGIDFQSNSKRTASQRDGNFIYYRYADILLMKAEALNEIGKPIEANALVRQTLERAGLSHVDVLQKANLRQTIMDERGREFIIEGKRWFDLLRNAKRDKFQNKQIIINMILSGADIKQQAILKTRVYDTMSYYLPIPENELLYNQNLVQNPYYDR
ncbi:MAG: RagB/SusD family nutrient uptake outer membrane protein [Prolixibacteraceae bacterium]|nr:RagB/SusD family nutrient uptake outer membrane protein [Prolixibacteraceae bacterium]